ncbi:MAG TPA: translocation/assembly module TamB domain-containing protein, partial [Minicystis sp.]|nr:translocation/assembly module TamB domain-containing protein [Minicystis sp.]
RESPRVELALTADGYPTIDGHAGRAAIDVAGDRHGARAKAALGSDAGEGVHVEASLPLPDKIGLLNLPEATAKLTAEGVELASVLPAALVARQGVTVGGKLDAELDARLGVKPTLHGVGLKADVRGGARVANGRVAFAGSRAFDGIDLALDTDDGEIRIKRLHLQDADPSRRDRTLDVTGRLAWEDLAFQSADVRVAAHDFRLSAADRAAALTADVAIHADLDAPLKTVTATVKQLALRLPDRIDRTRRAPGASSASAAADAGRGWAVHVRLADRARVEQAAFDLAAEGGVDIAFRPSGHRVRGKLTMVSGAFTLGPRRHALERGSVTFDDAHPDGFLDLHFGGRPLRVDVVGPFGAQKVTVRGPNDAVLFERVAGAGPSDDHGHETAAATR